MSTIVQLILVVLPLIILVVDFLSYPVFKTRIKREKLNISSLLTEPIIEMGTYNANRVQIALDSVNNEDFLNYETKGSRGLIVSHFVDEGDRSIREGELGRAVQSKINQFSPVDNQKLVDNRAAESMARRGEIFEIPLTIAKNNYRCFPVDRLFIILLGLEAGAHLTVNSLVNVLDRAKKAHLSKLVLPCLGYRWDDKNSGSFDDYFTVVFGALAKTPGYTNICLSIYDAWPTFTLEEAVSSLNRIWTSTFSHQKLEINRVDLRAVLLFTPICLVASSFHTALTPLHFLIIAISYASLATGSSKLIKFYTQGQPPIRRLIVQLTIWVILAIAFPFLAHWKELFGTGGK